MIAASLRHGRGRGPFADPSQPRPGELFAESLIERTVPSSVKADVDVLPRQDTYDVTNDLGERRAASVGRDFIGGLPFGTLRRNATETTSYSHLESHFEAALKDKSTTACPHITGSMRNPYVLLTKRSDSRGVLKHLFCLACWDVTNARKATALTTCHDCGQSFARNKMNMFELGNGVNRSTVDICFLCAPKWFERTAEVTSGEMHSHEDQSVLLKLEERAAVLEEALNIRRDGLMQENAKPRKGKTGERPKVAKPQVERAPIPTMTPRLDADKAPPGAKHSLLPSTWFEKDAAELLGLERWPSREAAHLAKDLGLHTNEDDVYSEATARSVEHSVIEDDGFDPIKDLEPWHPYRRDEETMMAAKNRFSDSPSSNFRSDEEILRAALGNRPLASDLTTIEPELEDADLDVSIESKFESIAEKYAKASEEFASKYQELLETKPNSAADVLGKSSNMISGTEDKGSKWRIASRASDSVDQKLLKWADKLDLSVYAKEDAEPSAVSELGALKERARELEMENVRLKVMMEQLTVGTDDDNATESNEDVQLENVSPVPMIHKQSMAQPTVRSIDKGLKISSTLADIKVTIKETKSVPLSKPSLPKDSAPVRATVQSISRPSTPNTSSSGWIAKGEAPVSLPAEREQPIEEVTRSKIASLLPKASRKLLSQKAAKLQSKSSKAEKHVPESNAASVTEESAENVPEEFSLPSDPSVLSLPEPPEEEIQQETLPSPENEDDSRPVSREQRIVQAHLQIRGGKETVIPLSSIKRSDLGLPKKDIPEPTARDAEFLNQLRVARVQRTRAAHEALRLNASNYVSVVRNVTNEPRLPIDVHGISPFAPVSLASIDGKRIFTHKLTMLKKSREESSHEASSSNNEDAISSVLDKDVSGDSGTDRSEYELIYSQADEEKALEIGLGSTQDIYEVIGDSEKEEEEEEEKDVEAGDDDENDDMLQSEPCDEVLPLDAPIALSIDTAVTEIAIVRVMADASTSPHTTPRTFLSALKEEDVSAVQTTGNEIDVHANNSVAGKEEVDNALQLDESGRENASSQGADANVDTKPTKLSPSSSALRPGDSDVPADNPISRTLSVLQASSALLKMHSKIASTIEQPESEEDKDDDHFEAVHVSWMGDDYELGPPLATQPHSSVEYILPETRTVHEVEPVATNGGEGSSDTSENAKDLDTDKKMDQVGSSSERSFLDRELSRLASDNSSADGRYEPVPTYSPFALKPVAATHVESWEYRPIRQVLGKAPLVPLEMQHASDHNQSGTVFNLDPDLLDDEPNSNPTPAFSAYSYEDALQRMAQIAGAASHDYAVGSSTLTGLEELHYDYTMYSRNARNSVDLERVHAMMSEARSRGADTKYDGSGPMPFVPTGSDPYERAGAERPREREAYTGDGITVGKWKSRAREGIEKAKGRFHKGRHALEGNTIGAVTHGEAKRELDLQPETSASSFKAKGTMIVLNSTGSGIDSILSKKREHKGVNKWVSTIGKDLTSWVLIELPHIRQKSLRVRIGLVDEFTAPRLLRVLHSAHLNGPYSVVGPDLPLTKNALPSFLAGRDSFLTSHDFHLGEDVSVLKYVRLCFVGCVSPLGACHTLSRLRVDARPERFRRPLGMRVPQKGKESFDGVEGEEGGYYEREEGTTYETDGKYRISPELRDLENELFHTRMKLRRAADALEYAQCEFE